MMIGTIIGEKYELLELIASGGMGSVYRARHVISQRVVALKVLHGHIANRPNTLRRFRREASAASKVDHAGLVQVLDAGKDDEHKTFFIAMELLTGQDFREWLDSPKRSVSGGVELILEILEPLDALHKHEMVHRDLKPENIYLATTKSGARQVKILDFGIARSNDLEQRTDSGVSLGTPQYMAPEQVMHANRATPATDIWAVGVMLYEALTGMLPFEAETPEALLVKACSKPHRPIAEVWPDVPEAVAEIIDGCLEKDANKRISDALDLKRRLIMATQRGSVERDEVLTAAIAVAIQTDPDSVGSGEVSERELEEYCINRLVGILPMYRGSRNNSREGTLTVLFMSEGPDDNAVERACACALKMQLKMLEINEWCRARGGSDLQLRIGVDSGMTLVELLDGKPIGHNSLAANNIARQATRVQDLATPATVALSAKARGVINAQLDVIETQEISANPLSPSRSITSVRGIGAPYSVYNSDSPVPIRSSAPERESGRSNPNLLAPSPHESWHSGWGVATTLGNTPRHPVRATAETMPSGEIPVARPRFGFREWRALAVSLTVGVVIGGGIWGVAVPIMWPTTDPTQIADVPTNPPSLSAATTTTLDSSLPDVAAQANLPSPAPPTRVMEPATEETQSPEPSSAEDEPEELTFRRVGGQSEGWLYQVPEDWEANPNVSALSHFEHTLYGLAFEVTLHRESYAGTLQAYREYGDQSIRAQRERIDRLDDSDPARPIALRNAAMIVETRPSSVGTLSAFQRRLRYAYSGLSGWQRITVHGGFGYLLQCRYPRTRSDNNRGQETCIQILESLRVGEGLD